MLNFITRNLITQNLITWPSFSRAGPKLGSRLGLTVALAWLLTGCAAAVPMVADRVMEFSQFFMAEDEPADRGLIARAGAAIAMGRYAEAETYLNAALSIDPYDDRALRQLAVVYRLTGRSAKAQSYEQMTRDVVIVDSGSWNLSEVDTPPPAGTNNIQRFVALNRLLDAGYITEDEYDERREANLGLLLPLTNPAPTFDIERELPQVRDIVERLGTINGFKKVGALDLVSYNRERNAILEGLLPMPKSTRRTVIGFTPEALDPEAHQQWLDRLLATELITPREYKKENDVLIGLYAPAAGTDEEADSPASRPLSMNDRPMTVMDEETMAREETVDREEALAQEAQAQEAQVVEALTVEEAAIMPDVQSDEAEGVATVDDSTPTAAASVTRVNIHLALSRTPESAQRSWDELQLANGLALDGLIPRVSRIDLGGGKGIFFQLSAGPLADMATAEQLCDELLSRDYYCAPLVF